MTTPRPTERLLTRRELANRWSCSTETVKRKTAAGILTPVRFGLRFVRYRLSEIELLETQAAGGRK
jgi:predicted DNA-binding transcriptional regulator AlpA